MAATGLLLKVLSCLAFLLRGKNRDAQTARIEVSVDLWDCDKRLNGRI